MEFRKCERKAELFLLDEWREWRLASVDEVNSCGGGTTNNQILDPLDVVRLLDGWVDDPGNQYNTGKEYRSNMKHMLLVKTAGLREPDFSHMEKMYFGVGLDSEGREAALLLSCEDKNTEVMYFALRSVGVEKELHRMTESLNKTFSHRRTILHYAADQPHNEFHAVIIAEYLRTIFSHENDYLKAADRDGRTALHFAALHGHTDLCKFLMNECRLKANEKDQNGESLLHFAVKSNKTDTVRMLWEFSEVKNLIVSQDKKGTTPLHIAAANGNTEIIDILLGGMNEVRLKKCIRQPDLLGQTALHLASSGGHTEAVEKLSRYISKNLHMEFKKCERSAKLFLLQEWRLWRLASVDEVRMNMETIKEKQILDSWDTARLLDGWVDGPGYRYNTGIEYRSKMAHMLLVKTPVSRQSDGTFDEEMYSEVELNTEGRKAALLLSCDDKITEVMCFVLKSVIERFQAHGERQAELDLLTKSLKETFSHRRTVLHYAADQPYNGKHAECVAELVLGNFEYGKELIKAADLYGRTVLHFAALHGHSHLCTFLMHNCGLKAGENDRNGENILHFVVNSNKQDEVLSWLKMNEVRNLVASQDAKGRIPLHKAAANGNTEIIETLIGKVEGNSEGYIRRADLSGQTALHEAASGGHLEVVRYLLGKGSRPLFERNSEGKTALHYSVQLTDQQKAKEMAEILLTTCRSDEEKLLLLWASATGMGTAEQSAESKSEVQKYLKQQRELAAGSSTDLLVSAIKLGYEALAWELINRGADTGKINKYESGLSRDEQQRVKNCMLSSYPFPLDPRIILFE